MLRFSSLIIYKFYTLIFFLLFLNICKKVLLSSNFTSFDIYHTKSEPIKLPNIHNIIDELKERGLWIAGTDAKGKTDYRNLDGTMPIGLVIGSEGKGMSRIIGEKCDFLITLPMVGKVTSLNASVAASLLMYEVYRKRHEIGK